MIFGTAGHIDHGKTSLVKAITGVDADRLKEEKERGITIDLGFAYWPQEDGSVIGFVDVPGHERFVHTMVAGAQGIERVLLVVAADDGVMPQTREHLEIVSLLGLTAGAVVVSKIDLVDEVRLAEVVNDIQVALEGTPLAGAPVFPVSIRSGEGLPALTDWLKVQAAGRAVSSEERLFRLSVDRVFVLAGSGVVVTGTVLDGAIRTGDEVVVSPTGLLGRVRSIYAQNRRSEIGIAGQRCALNLAGPGIDRDAMRRGDMVMTPAAHEPTQRIDVRLTVAPGAAKGLRSWMPVRVHHGTGDIPARVVLLEDNPPGPSDDAFVQLVLERPIAARRQDRFVLRDTSASVTLGGGRIVDLRAPERKRRTPERRALLEALREPDAALALAGALSVGGAPVDLAGFARDEGLTLEKAQALAETVGARSWIVGRTAYVMAKQAVADVAARVERELADFHRLNPDLAGMGLERLRLAAAPRLPAPLFRLALRAFAAEGRIVLDGNWTRLASHTIEITPEEENLWHEIGPLLAGGERFRPPRVRDIAGQLDEDEADIRRLMRRFGRAGAIDEVAQDHFFLRRTVAEAVTLACGVQAAANGWFNAAAFRDTLEAASGATVGRKVAIQLLEFLDRHGVTIRRGDVRRVNPHRRDLFDVDKGIAGDDDAELGREASPVGRPDFKSGWGCETVSGGFDSHSLPPAHEGSSRRAGHA